VASKTKSKGTYYERSVMNIFDTYGYASIRTLGSGGGTKKPKPDIITSNGTNTYAIEVKQRNSNVLYISWSQINELKRFSITFGATPLIVYKFGRRPFKVIEANSIQKNNSKNYKITITDATMKLTNYIGASE